MLHTFRSRSALLSLLAAGTLVTTTHAQATTASRHDQAAKVTAEIAAMLPSAEEGQDKQVKEKNEVVELISIDSRLIKGKPFSADTTTDIVQTLSDGNHIAHHTISKFYRDSSGRTRREQTFGNVDPSNPGPHEVKIFVDDPVANAAYVFDPGEKSVIRRTRSSKFLDERENQNNPSVGSLPKLDESRDIVKQDLGQKTIEGVACTGTMQTITIPAGQIGNEQPIAIVTETWFAPSIDAIVQSSTNDPRFGNTVYQLHNIQLSEQPLSLFEPPANYAVQTARRLQN